MIDGPSYQGIVFVRSTTLSPLSADTGIATTCGTFSRAAVVRTMPTISSKVACS